MQAYVVYADGQARSVVPMAEQWVRGGPSWIVSAYWSMANLCRFLTRRLNRKVIDKTGVAGMFNIIDVFNMRVDFDRPSTLVDMVDLSNLTALDPAATIEQDLQRLGLRLESTKEATEFIVIDHVERPSGD